MNGPMQTTEIVASSKMLVTAGHLDGLLKGFVVRCVCSMMGTDSILYCATETGKKLGGLKKSDVAFHGIQELQI
ncbi:Pyruvate kinase [Phytophthora cinnamomi]|uniref:Pyruvate kinase n=1 Tax=Phytophthora cinnamomi TaxID=4785 RepID=UPI00355A6EC4|nr:Pyruvate kinase [Phytophthora cinnamomi]